MNRKTVVVLIAFALAAALVGCSSGPAPEGKSQSSPGMAQAVKDAVDVYVYGYPLVTMDMTRKQFTNVASSDLAHAPMGQILKLRTYPAVDNHAVTAPNADTLYTTTWLERSREPWVFSVPNMGDRYYLLPKTLDGYTNVFQVPGKAHHGGMVVVCHHRTGVVGNAT